MKLLAASFLAAAGMIGAAFGQDAYQALPDASSLAEGNVQLSPTVPAMGEHWGNVADMPLGPIYCVHKGKIVCLEFMIAQEDFEAGKSWPKLSGMEGLPPVNHVSIAFEPQGHDGFTVPHYDIHMYFLSPEEVAKIQPE
jgi:hypothetical protein